MGWLTSPVSSLRLEAGPPSLRLRYIYDEQVDSPTLDDHLHMNNPVLYIPIYPNMMLYQFLHSHIITSRLYGVGSVGRSRQQNPTG